MLTVESTKYKLQRQTCPNTFLPQCAYLRSYKAIIVKVALSLCMGRILIKIQKSRPFFDGVTRVLDGHVTVEFLANKGRFIRICNTT
jgi:methyl coenzyme M reductase subunit D